jgi:hypothetical protein
MIRLDADNLAEILDEFILNYVSSSKLIPSSSFFTGKITNAPQTVDQAPISPNRGSNIGMSKPSFFPLTMRRRQGRRSLSWRPRDSEMAWQVS